MNCLQELHPLREPSLKCQMHFVMDSECIKVMGPHHYGMLIGYLVENCAIDLIMSIYRILSLKLMMFGGMKLGISMVLLPNPR